MKRLGSLFSFLILSFFGTGFLFLAQGNVAHAQDDRVISETERGDVNVFGGDVTLEEGIDVKGDLHVFGGDVTLLGTVEGDLVVFGGDVDVADSATIKGECIIFGGDIDGPAESSCSSIADDFDASNFVGALPNFFGMPDAPTPPESRIDSPSRNRDGFSLGWTIFSTLASGFAAFLIASVAPRPLDRVGNAVSTRPVTVGTVGFLTFFSWIAGMVIVGILTGLLAIILIGLLGIPVLGALTILFVAAAVFAWVTVGTLFGEILAERLKISRPSLTWTAVVGTVALTLILSIIEVLPLGGTGASVARFAILCVGLGGVALTRFGTHSYPRFAVKPTPEADYLDELM